MTINQGYISSPLELTKQEDKQTFLRFQVACRKRFSVQYVDFVAWDKTAKNIAKYCKTGDQIMIEGETVKGTYETKTKNVMRSRQEIRVVNVGFIGPKEVTLESELPEDFKINRKMEDFEESSDE